MSILQTSLKKSFSGAFFEVCADSWYLALRMPWYLPGKRKPRVVTFKTTSLFRPYGLRVQFRVIFGEAMDPQNHSYGHMSLLQTSLKKSFSGAFFEVCAGSWYLALRMPWYLPGKRKPRVVTFKTTSLFRPHGLRVEFRVIFEEAMDPRTTVRTI